MALPGPVGFADKVRVPARPPAMVRRQRLLDRLHAQIDRRLLLITAPGGYGKTTLLVDFASDAGFPIAWYTLEAADHDLRSFAHYLALAIQEQFPRFGAQTLDLVTANPDRPLDVRQLVSTVTHEIEQQVPSFFALVLDDYHLVGAAEEVNQAVDLLLAHLPDNCRLVISGRSIPTKLRLTRLAAQQQVAGFGATDLAFTVQEIQELVRRRFQVELDESEAAELREHSHGWITAVLLSGSLWSSQLAQKFPQFTNSATDLFNYLTEEVLSQLDFDTQDFLLESSVLRHVDANWCDRVLGRSESAAILDEFSRTLLFVSKGDGDPTRYRYHPLFQEYLEGKLREEQPERYAALHLAAGNVAEDGGDAEGAIEYYLRGGHGEDAARLIRMTADRLIEQGKWLTLRDWFDLLPGEALVERPDLSLVHAQALSRTGQYDRALLTVNAAHRVFTEHGEVLGQAQCLLTQARIAFDRGDFVETGHLAQTALGLLPAEDLKLRCQAHEHLGLSLRHQGRIPQALVELRRSIALASDLGDFVRQANIERSIASVFIASDELDEAEAHYRTALTIWQHLGDVSMQAAGLNGLAIVAERRGDYEASGSLYREALQKVRDVGSYPFLEAVIYRNLAEQAVDLGSYQDALALCDEALTEARSLDANWLMAGVEVVRSRAYLALGRKGEAGRAARSAHRLARRFGTPNYIGMALGCMASVSAAEGRHEEASGYFERATRLFKRAKAFREMARTQFEYALSLGHVGEQARARIMLKASFDLASRIGQEALLVVEANQYLDQLQALAKTFDNERVPALIESAVQWRQRYGRERTARIPSESSPWLAAHGFGPPEVTKAMVPIISTEWETARAKELFFLLLAHPGGLRKEQMVADLWPDASEARGNSQFHSTLYRVRRAVAADCVVFAGGRYKLNPALSLWSDVAEFQHLLTRAFRLPQDSPEMAELCQKAAELYRGPYLEGFYSEWSQHLQERLQARYLQALSRLARYHQARHEYRRSLEYSERALMVDNTLEAVHLQVMQVHAQAGESDLAVQHYVSYSQWLRREMGEIPAMPLRRAYEALLQAGPASPQRAEIISRAR